MVGALEINAKRILAFVAFVGLIALATPQYWDWVELAAHRIRTPDPRLDYLWGLLWGAALFASFFLWPVTRSERSALSWLWLAKLETMLGYMLLYEWNYGLDAYWYYFVGSHTDPSTISFSEQRGNSIMFWLASIQHHYLVPDSYHATKISFGYLGLISTFAFYRAAKTFAPRVPESVLWLLGLFPSTLQWTSILGKDPIVALGVGVYAWGAALLYRQQQRGLVAVAIGVLVSWSIRPWMAAILTVPLVLLFTPARQHPLRTAIMSVLAIASMVIAVGGFQEYFKVQNIEDVVERSSQIGKGFSDGGSGRRSEVSDNPPSLAAMLAFAPLGLASALVRPLPGEVLNAFGVLAGLENLLLLWLLQRAVRRRNTALFAEPPIRWGLALVGVWGLVYGYVCFHNAGTSVRYRQQIFPIFVGVLLAFSAQRDSRQNTGPQGRIRKRELSAAVK